MAVGDVVKMKKLHGLNHFRVVSFLNKICSDFVPSTFLRIDLGGSLEDLNIFKQSNLT